VICPPKGIRDHIEQGHLKEVRYSKITKYSRINIILTVLSVRIYHSKSIALEKGEERL